MRMSPWLPISFPWGRDPPSRFGMAVAVTKDVAGQGGILINRLI
jgi:hypothetical protein